MMTKLFFKEGQLYYSRRWPAVPPVNASINKDLTLINKFEREMAFLMRNPVPVLNNQEVIYFIKRLPFDLKNTDFIDLDCPVEIKTVASGSACTVILPNSKPSVDERMSSLANELNNAQRMELIHILMGKMEKMDDRKDMWFHCAMTIFFCRPADIILKVSQNSDTQEYCLTLAHKDNPKGGLESTSFTYEGLFTGAIEWCIRKSLEPNADLMQDLSVPRNPSPWININDRLPDYDQLVRVKSLSAQSDIAVIAKRMSTKGGEDYWVNEDGYLIYFVEQWSEFEF